MARPGPLKGNTSVRLLLTLLIVILLLGWMFHDVDVPAALQTLNEAEARIWIWVPLGYLLLYIARVYRFRSLPALANTRFDLLLSIVSLHNFWNNVLPVRAGELSFVYLLRKHLNVNIGSSAGMLLVIRLFDFVASLLFFLLSLYLTGTAARETTAAPVFVVVALAIFAIILWKLSLIAEYSTAILDRVLPDFKIKASLLTTLGNLRRTTREIGTLSAYTRLLLTTILCNGCAYAIFYAVLRSMHVSLSVWQVILGATFAMFAVMLPINAPGNVGPLDAGWVTGFLLVGLDKEVCLATAMLMHLLLLLSVCLLAACGHTYMTLRARPPGKGG